MGRERVAEILTTPPRVGLLQDLESIEFRARGPVRALGEAGRLRALSSACVDLGANSRRRAMDVCIAATALVLDVPLLTLDDGLLVIEDLLDLRVLR